MKSFASAALLVLLSGSAMADELLLEDGSRLTGTLKSLGPDRASFETAFAGVLEIERGAILGIRSDSALEVTLATGDRLIGTLSWNDETGQTLASDLVGAISLADGAIVAAARPGESPDPAVIRAEMEERVAALERDHKTQIAEIEAQREPDPSAVWSGDVAIGVNGADGNTEEFSFNGTASARRETEFDRLLLGFSARFAEQAGEETENEFIGTAGLERDFGPRWFALGALRLERDEFEDLDLRANIDFGAGYFLVREEHHEFKPRIGIGYQVEAYQDSSNEEDLVGLAGWDWRYEMTDRWRFKHSLDWRPTFDDPTGDYRLDSRAELISLMNGALWNLRLGLRNEYNAAPEPGIEKLDTTYTVSLQRVFE